MVSVGLVCRDGRMAHEATGLCTREWAAPDGIRNLDTIATWRREGMEVVGPPIRPGKSPQRYNVAYSTHSWRN